MFNVLDNATTMKQDQLIFLQKIIETINSALEVRRMSTDELQKIMLGIPLENLNVEDVKSLCENLKKLLEDEDRAVTYLMDKLSDYRTRYLASSLLGWFGNSASVAIPKLIDLASGHGPAAGAAQKAILFIRGAEPKILHAVEEALSLEDDESFRQLSVLAVKTDLKKSEVFFEVLAEGAIHENPNIRETVADTIGNLQTSDSKKIKSLLLLLSVDENRAVRDAALDALDTI